MADPLNEPVTLNAVFQCLGRMEGTLDALHEKIDTHLDDDTRVHADLERRMRTQESFRWRLVGMALLLAAAPAGAVYALVKDIL